MKPNLPEATPRPAQTGLGNKLPAGQERFLRITHDAKLNVSHDLPTSLDGYELSLMGNLPFENQELHDQGTSYPSIELEGLNAGHYYFKARLDKEGSETLSNPKGYTHLMVDPSGLDNIRLYSFIPNISGSIDDWIADLPRIKALGFNTLHLLPITPMDASQSPYSARSFYGVDERYLKEGGASLEDFVNEAKNLNIGLCFDLVLNHVGVTSDLAKQCPEWIHSDYERVDGLKRAGCWHGDSWLTWEDLALIHYDHPDAVTRQEIWDYMLGVLLHWSAMAEATGGMIRLDNLHSTEPNFLRWAMAKLHQTHPKLIVLGELFASKEEQRSMVLEHGLHLLLATPWDKHYVPDLRNLVRELHEDYPRLKFILPISSHDSGTPTQEFYDVRATVPRYAVSALLNTGATGMCQGVEYGAAQKLEFIGHQGKVAIQGPVEFHDEISDLNQLMEDHSLLRQGGNLHFIDNQHGAILGAYRHSFDPQKPSLVVLINLDLHHEQSIQLQPDDSHLAKGDQLRNLFGYHRGTMHDLPSTIKLPPCGVRLLEVLHN
jgi:hypothetical protein